MKKLLPKILPLSIISLQLFVPSVLAHGGEEEEVAETVTRTLEDSIRSNSVKVVVVASVLVLGFVVLTILLRHLGEKVKTILFLGIVLPVLFTTVYLIGSTIYLNATSSSGGPVHWHADFEIWDCGKKLDLVDPQGLSNKIGTSTFHEHNDNRIHVEGVVTDPKEASLGKFFGFVGGKLSEDGFELPTNEGIAVRHDGDLCPDGRVGKLQVFVFKIANASANQKSNFVYEHSKLEEPTAYILSPFGNVPPGDCIIIEFGEEQAETDKLCDSYKLQELKGNLYGN